MAFRRTRNRLVPILLTGLLAAAPASAQEFDQLTDQQQELLAPLAEVWDQIEPPRRERLVHMAERVADGTPQQKERFQRGLDRFMSLDATERQQVQRLFDRFRHLPPHERRQVIHRVQAMSEEQRQAFAFGMRIADRTRGFGAMMSDRADGQVEAWLRDLPPDERRELMMQLKDLSPSDRLRRLADEMDARQSDDAASASDG